jgi:hypothetical protein
MRRRSRRGSFVQSEIARGAVLLENAVGGRITKS